MLNPSDIAQAFQGFRNHPSGPTTTPCTLAPELSALIGLPVYLKMEHLQTTGSFKYRGAFHKISQLSAEQRDAGVVAASTGNHGLGVIRAAQVFGTTPLLVVPTNALPLKIAKMERLGAQVVKIEGDCLVAERHARNLALESGRTFVSPYNDQTVVAGQGTVGFELDQEDLDFAAVFVAVGGGGLIGGIGSFLHSVRPQVQMVGCWSEASPVLLRSLEQGQMVEVTEEETLADGTAGGLEPDTLTFPLCQQVIQHHAVVTERAIATALLELETHAGLRVEGSAALAWAACRQEAARFGGKPVVVVLCGGNVDEGTFVRARQLVSP